MEMNDENPNADYRNDLSKNLPSGEEISSNQSLSKDALPTHRISVELKKTAWDITVQILQVVSSIGLILVTLYLANITDKQRTVATKQLEVAASQTDLVSRQAGAAEKQARASEKQAALANEQIKVAKAQNELIMRMGVQSKSV
jgi:hypothetical protein